MKTDLCHGLGLHLALVIPTFLYAGFAPARQQNLVDTNVYRITTFAGDDEGRIGNWYDDFYAAHRHLVANRLSPALPEELPAPDDTNGHWGAATDGLQLSVRFHRRGFLPGEPVSAMVLLRNLDSSPRRTFIRNYAKADTRKNFCYALHYGTNVINWKWSDPPPPNPVPNGYQPPRYFLHPTMDPHSQIVFFVRLASVFDLSQPRDYSVQLSRDERRRAGSATTNILSSAATSQVVEKLSPSELAATNALARYLRETERKAREASSSAARERPGTGEGK